MCPPPSYAHGMAARVVAVLAAVAMVAGALFARGRLDDRKERTSTTLRLVCDVALADACNALAEGNSTVEVTTEPAATTADALTKLAPGKKAAFDGWLVTAPWPAIVKEARGRDGKSSIVTAGNVLARSPVVLAVRASRRVVLNAACNEDPGWKCIGDLAGKRWAELPSGQGQLGTVTPGHPPVSTVAGLTVMGSATVGYFDGTLSGEPSGLMPLDLSRTDLEEEGFQSWLDRLEQAIPERPPSPFQTLLQRPTAFDVVGALEAEAGPLLATAASTKPVLLYPSPVTTADVVLATTGGRPAELLITLLAAKSGREALATTGWRVEGEPAATGIKTDVLPPSSNLPDPGVLDALRRRVEQSR